MIFGGSSRVGDGGASPFDTSWWRLPAQAQVVERPPPPQVFPRQLNVTRADIIGLQQNDERRLMEAEDELARRLRQAENAANIEERYLLSQFIKGVIDRSLALAMVAVSKLDAARQREQKHMLLEDQHAQSMKHDAQRRRLLCEYTEFARKRIAAQPPAEVHNSAEIRWTCLNCQFRNTQLLHQCFRVVKLGNLLLPRAFNQLLICRCRKKRRREQQNDDEGAAERQWQEREQEEQAKALARGAPRSYGLKDRRKALAGVGLVEKARCNEDVKLVLELMHTYRGLTDVQAACASALASILAAQQRHREAPGRSSSRRQSRPPVDAEAILQAVLLAYYTDTNHVYLCRGVLEALLPLVKTWLLHQLSLTPASSNPASFLPSLVPAINAPRSFSEGMCQADGKREGWRERRRGSARVINLVQRVITCVCKAMSRFPQDSIVHCNGANVLCLLVFKLHDAQDEDKAEVPEGCDPLLLFLHEQGATAALQLTLNINKFWSRRARLRDACQRALFILQESNVCVAPVDNALRITFTELPEVDLDSGPEDEANNHEAQTHYRI